MTKILLVALILLISLLPAISRMSIPAVHADGTGPYAMIFPVNGSISTNISIEVRNLTYNVHYDLYLYWDNVPQI